MISKYKRLLHLDEAAEFVRIEHFDAMVDTVYKVLQPGRSPLILKICKRHDDYVTENYCLNYFAHIIPVPKIISALPPNNNLSTAILMEYLDGDLLRVSTLTPGLAFELGQALALIPLIGLA